MSIPIISIPLKEYIEFLRDKSNPLLKFTYITREQAISIRKIKGYQQLCSVKSTLEDEYRLFRKSEWDQINLLQLKEKEYHNERRMLLLRFEKKLDTFCKVLESALPGMASTIKEILHKSFLHQKKDVLEKYQIMDSVEKIYTSYHQLEKPTKESV
tara:strand:+ start:4381 stop:4848 length:468 start_codon:yes stop_codon:yes gene_type:complete